jgi:DNA-3-methyladenine glycosylase I
MQQVIRSSEPLRSRCKWANDPLLEDYHDNEWGVRPTTEEQWFEFVVLETFQAGLSWKTILHKRPAFRQAFHQFSIDSVAQYTEEDVQRLMQNTGIVRNRKKIEAAVHNARIARELQKEHRSLGAYLTSLADTPDLMSGLQKTFRFVGRTTAESIAFATGLIAPEHETDCWMHQT